MSEGRFSPSPEDQIKKSEIEIAFENQQEAMRWYKEATDAVKPDVRTQTGAIKNNYELHKEGKLSKEDAEEIRKRAADAAHARDALEIADRQLKNVADKYANDDPSDLPPSLL